jgi:hypothetical protein
MEKVFVKFLKWLGLIALLSLPVILLAKSKSSKAIAEPGDEDNIFSEELQG